MSTDPCYVFDNLRYDRELRRRGASEFPCALLLRGEPVMRQCCRTRRQPGNSGAPTSEKLVRREIDAVNRCLLQVNHTVRRVLYRVHNDEKPRLFLTGLLDD